MREAAWGGGLLSLAEQPGGSGDGEAAQLKPMLRPRRHK